MDARSFLARYAARAMATRSVGCMGLDLEASHIPPAFGSPSVLQSWEGYLKELIDVAAEHFPVIKPQVAYYEFLDHDGLTLLRMIVEYAHSKGLLVVLDAKRNDIGKTEDMYGGWILGDYAFDATTVNTYLGPTFMPAEDGLHWGPYLEAGQMPIMMIRTSNPEAGWLQDLELKNGRRVWQVVADKVASLNAQVHEMYGDIAAIGGVMGATYPDDGVMCRLIAPDVFTLIPGYGAQGGAADGAVKPFPLDGRLLGTVNNSRGLTLTSWFDKKSGQPKPGDPMDHIRQACAKMNEELNAALAAYTGGDPYTF